VRGVFSPSIPPGGGTPFSAERMRWPCARRALSAADRARQAQRRAARQDRLLRSAGGPLIAVPGLTDPIQEVGERVANHYSIAWPMPGAHAPIVFRLWLGAAPDTQFACSLSAVRESNRAWAVQVRERRECGMRRAARPGGGSRQRSRRGGGGRRQVETPTRYCSRCGQQMEVVRAIPGEPSWRAQFRCINPECGK
jgi:hypothetical protein